MVKDFLNDEVKDQVKELFSSLKDEVKIVYHGNSSVQLNDEIFHLLKEVADLSDKVNLEKIDEANELTPYFDLVGKNKGTVRFMGIPSGHEFTTLLNSIVLVSTGEHNLSKQSVEFLESLDKPLDLKVFITPTCPYCPMAVFLAHRFAMVSDNVVASMVEAMEFPQLSQKFNISSVPHTIINDKDGFVGAMPEQNAIEEIKKRV